MIATKGVAYVIDLKGNLDRKAGEAEASLGRLESQSARTKAGLAIVATAAVAVGVALGDMVDDVVGAVDELHTLAGVTGLSASTIETLSIAAKMSRKDLSDLVPRNFAKNMEDARNGTGKAVDGFKMLGLEQDELRAKFSNNDELFRETIARLLAMEDPALRAAAASEILGKQGEQMLTAFGDIDDFDAINKYAERFGYDTGPAAAAAAGDVQRGMAGLDIALDTVKQEFFDVLAAGDDIMVVFSAIGVGAGEMAAGVVEAVSAMTTAVTSFAAGNLEALQVWNIMEDDYRGLPTLISDTATEFWNSDFRSLPKLMYDSADAASTFYDETKALNEELSTTSETAQEAAPVFETFGPTLKQMGENSDKAAKGVRNLRKELELLTREEMNRIEAQNEADAAALAKERENNSVYMRNKRGVEANALVYAPQGQMLDVEHYISPGSGIVADLTGSGILGALDLVNGYLGAANMSLTALEAIPSQLDSLTQKVEALPETLVSIPQLFVGLLDALTDLPVELVRALPELALGIGDAVFTSFTYGFEAFAVLLGEALAGLPGKFAQSLADVLQNLFAELNPFDGEGGGISVGGKLGAKVEDFLGIDIPLLNTGGHIAGEGLAYVHQGERVLTRSETRTYNQQRTYGDIHIHGDSYRTREQLRQLMSPYGPGRGLLTTGWGM